MADKTQRIPDEMRRVHGRFERYRKAHTGRRPIPEALWKMAADLASEHAGSVANVVDLIWYGIS